MTQTVRRRLLAGAGVVAISVLAELVAGPLARAQGWPARPVRLVVPWPAGGGTDVVVRVYAKHLADRLGQNVLVENRPGANGMIGTEFAARSAPDGYTLAIASVETHAIGPQVYRKVAYDAQRGFEPLGNIGAFPYALVIRPGLPVATVEAFLAHARRPDSKLTYGSWGVGSSSQVTMEMVKAAARIDMMHVPFTGAAPALAALAGEQIDALMIPVSVAASYHDTGKARILAIAAPGRLVELPRIPTLRERGLDVVGGTWLVIAAPAGIAPAVARRLNEETERVVQDPGFVEAMQRLSVVPGGGSMEDVRRMMAAEYRRWGEAIRKADIRLD